LRYLRNLAEDDERVRWFRGYSADEIREILWHRDTRVVWVEVDSGRRLEYARLDAVIRGRKVTWDLGIPGGLPPELRQEVIQLARAEQCMEIFGVFKRNRKAVA